MKVILKQECGAWVAQGLDYELAAQGKTAEQAKASFECVLLAQAWLDRQSGKLPLDGVDPVVEWQSDSTVRE